MTSALHGAPTRVVKGRRGPGRGAGGHAGRCARGRRPLRRLLRSWVASHTALGLSERPVCCPSAGMKDRVLARLPGGTVGAADRPPAVSFPVLSASRLPGSLGNATKGKQVPTCGSQASGPRPEFGAREMGQSPFQERAQCVDPFPGEAASRAGICTRRLPEPAGAESAASGWPCRGLGGQLAGGAVALPRNLVLSTRGRLAAAGPWGGRWKRERQGGGRGAG